MLQLFGNLLGVNLKSLRSKMQNLKNYKKEEICCSKKKKKEI